MFYAIFVPRTSDLPENDSARPDFAELLFEDIKDAKAALKQHKGSRMKTFSDYEKAINFLKQTEQDESFIELDSSYTQDTLVNSLENLSLQASPRAASGIMGPPPAPSAKSPMTKVAAVASPTQKQTTTTTTTQTTEKSLDEAEPAYPTPKPAQLAKLRRLIEAGDSESVEETIWSNPRCLVSPCDSVVNLMAGPRYNACHIAAKSDKPEIMALLLDTITNSSFLRKLYPRESDANLQDRVEHLLDSYLNTPDRVQGNTPLHFACKWGHYRVVRVLLTFEGCDLTLRDSEGKTAEEGICSKYVPRPAPTNSSTNHNPDDENNEEGGEQSDMNNTSLGLNGSTAECDSETAVKNKIKRMFKHQLHLPLYRDQLKKRLLLERRRSRTNSQMDSDASFSDIDDSFILNSPIKSTTNLK